jgi:hypothetical protein
VKRTQAGPNGQKQYVQLSKPELAAAREEAQRLLQLLEEGASRPPGASVCLCVRLWAFEQRGGVHEVPPEWPRIGSLGAKGVGAVCSWVRPCRKSCVY